MRKNEINAFEIMLSVAAAFLVQKVRKGLQVTSSVP